MSSSTIPGDTAGPRRLIARVGLPALVVAAGFLAGFATRPATEPNAPGRSALDDGRELELSSISGVTRPSTQRRGPGTQLLGVSDDLVTATTVELHAVGLSIEELFDSEFRDVAWAPLTEGILREQFGEFLRVFLPDGSDFSAQCKQTICKLSFVVDADQEELAFGLQQMMPMGEIVQPWSEPLEDGSGKFRVGLRLLNGEDWLQLPAFRTRVRDEMTKRFPAGLESARKWLDEHGGLEAAVGMEEPK